MNKFAITLTKENDRQVLFVSNNKEEAFKKGDEIVKTLMRSSGTLSCIEANFDENNNLVGNSYKLLDSWI